MIVIPTCYSDGMQSHTLRLCTLVALGLHALGYAQAGTNLRFNYASKGMHV